MIGGCGPNRKPEGEAYIPLSPSKRGRSVPIWLETGRRLGLDEDSLDALRSVMAFHEGGMVEFPRRPDLPRHGPPIRPRGEATMDNMLALAKIVAEEHMKLPHHQEPAMDMSIGGGAGAGVGWQWQMAVLRQRFPGLQLISGYRPGAITVTGNPSWHGKGRAVDIPPRMDVNKWIAQTYGAGTKELIFSAPGATQIRHGRPHVYTGITKAMHYDHNHWAYKLGGILDGFTEQFNGLQSFDTGGFLRPGITLAHNGTGKPEPVGLGDFSEVTSQASRVGEEVLDALLSGVQLRASGVPQAFSEVGGGIAEGMAGGLRAGVPDVWSAMSMFSEAMPAKVKEQLGIESPSAVFHGYGHSVALGYANGIRAGIPAAQSAYADLMRASGMVQAEDGSWVPRTYWDKRNAARAARPHHPHPRRVIHEDQAGWNWRTMGNRMRGIQDRRGYWYHQHADGRITNTHPRNLGAPLPPRFHAGGFVSSSLPTTPGLRLDERLLIAQVGEAVVPRQQVIPTPIGPGASSGGTTVVNNIQATYEVHVDGEITGTTERKLLRMFDEHDRELARMVRAGTH